MAKTAERTTRTPWVELLVPLLPQALSAFFTSITTILVPLASPALALVVVIAQFLLLCLIFGGLAYLASPKKAKDRIRDVFRTQRRSVALVVTAGVIGGIVVVTLSWSHRIVPTPDLIGKNVAQANIELRNARLLPEKYVVPGSDDFSTITHQEPNPNVRVMKGSIVKFVVGVLVVKVEITDPTDQASCKQATVVRGTSEGIVESRGRLRASLLLHSFNADGYWVYGPLAVDAAGNWQHTVYVGQPSEVGRRFQLLVVVTQEPLKRQGSGGGPPEYQEIPPHVAIGKQVVVTRH